MCIDFIPIVRSAAATAINEVFPSDWILQFLLVKCLLRLQRLGLCLQHLGAFPFTDLPGIRLPNPYSQPQLHAVCPVTAGHPHLGVCSEITMKIRSSAKCRHPPIPTAISSANAQMRLQAEFPCSTPAVGTYIC